MLNECNSAVVSTFFALPFFGIEMKTYLFQSCGLCWIFQIFWHIECRTFTASSFRIWNSLAEIPSPPLALFIVMLPKAHLILHSKMSGSRWVTTPSWLSGSLRSFLYSYYLSEGFPCGSAGKESACNVGDLGSIPGLGRSPGKGKGCPLQYSSLENSTNCIVHGVAKSWTRLSDFHFHYLSESMLGKNEVIINCWKTVTCTWKELLYSNWLSENQYS